MATIEKDTQSITTITPTGYLALKDFDFKLAISEEMDGLKADFERIKMPSGGTTLFRVNLKTCVK